MDLKFMKEAIDLSSENNEGGPFGAIIVKNEKIIARGRNAVTSTNDPTAHAEIVSIRNACKILKSFTLDGCDIYTSCEPCPMCLSAIYWARIQNIYYANTKEDAAKIGFDDSYIYEQIILNPNQRSIKMIRLEVLDALDSFRKWNKNPNKTKY